jgi:hypothetical protein
VADDWMTNAFGLTAIHHGSSTGSVLDRTKIGKPEGTCETQLSHPASQKMSQVTYHKLDLCNLCNCFQMHNCSGYFFYHQKRRTSKLDDNSSDVSKKRKSLAEIQPAISTAKRLCQFGAGDEEHVGVVDTPGFECDTHPSITPEGHGFTNNLVFWSPRNTRRMVQTSMLLTQVWRGNLDVKPLLYQSDPLNPYPENIVTYSDYVVGYQMKGTQTLVIEREK